MEQVCIVKAKRTPQGRFLGGLKKFSAIELAVITAMEVLKGIDVGDIDQAIIGNVIMAGQGMNPARQVAVNAGIPIDRPAYTVNMMCASGMQAVLLAASAIQLGQAKMILCGGTESMSSAPFLLDRAREGYRMGDGVLIDSMLRDGLVDTFENEHMGMTAELIAGKYNISRQEQDEFALSSKERYFRALNEGIYDEELIKAGDLDHDEHPRPDTTIEKLAALKPAFMEKGTVTAGNASGINDGASMLVVCSEDYARKHRLDVMATIGSSASVGCDWKLMGLGPIYATRKLCRENNINIEDFDTVELNEAFASQSIACIRELNLDIDKVNPDGGAIVLGHPIGASGARLIVHLAIKIRQGRSKKALATLCVGGGMGSAVVLEGFNF
ncbi:MAG: acetyl-CoA C-acyltransferase [Actinobacteria bacterium]|nr:acetyl-CoA C-acyltransferase [Actinomycetota bacterium]